MTDIVEKLSKYVAGNSEEYKLFVESKETIEKLRAALRKIGYDYVELSYDKIEYFYREHMVIARNAYQDSFSEQQPIDYKTVDDNF